jgi:putative ABC transport system permease protein
MNRDIFDPDHWEDIFSHIKKHKARTLLTAFGVFWGIFLLLMLLAAGSGIEKGAYKQFGRMAVNSIHVWTEVTTLAWKGNKPGRWLNLTDADTEAIRDGVPGIIAVCPRLNIWWPTTTRYGKKEGSFTIQGEVPEVFRLEPIVMKEGRFINSRDVGESRKVVVIGTRVREILFAPEEDPVGKYIQIDGVSFLVIGVFAFDSFGGDQRGKAETIYMPISAMQRTFNMINRVFWFSILVDERAPTDETELAIKRLLAGRHDVHPDDQRAIGSWNSSREFKSIKGLFTGIRIFLWIVGLGTLLAGIIGVSNIMLIIVQERTREIGIRKALGATPLSIVSMVLQEAFLITAVSGLSGLLTSFAITEAVSWYMTKTNMQVDYFSNPEISLGVAFGALVLLILAGTLAGLFPALKAARIHPVEALREE